VGGQKTLRTYWKNYFEKTDTLIWVVDATDRERLDDCRQELKGLLVQEVRFRALTGRNVCTFADFRKRLMGASLLIFKNKSDVLECMTEDEIREVGRALRLSDLPANRPQIIRSLADHVLQGLQLDSIRTHKWHILPCSAMTGANLQEGLQWVVQDAKDRLFLY